MLSEHSPDTLALRLSGILKKSDYRRILPILESRIRQFGKINVYAEMEDITTMELPALWKHITFDVKHSNDYRRVAIVGGEKWMDIMTNFTDTFTTSDIRYFSAEDKLQARNWVLNIY